MADMSDLDDEPTVSRSRPSAPLPRARRPHVLDLLKGPGAPMRVLLDRDELVLGRSESADVQLESDQLSRRHVRFVLREGEYTCEDLDSRNGVYLNGVRIHSAVLREGDQLDIGGAIFVYHEGV